MLVTLLSSYQEDTSQKLNQIHIVVVPVIFGLVTDPKCTITVGGMFCWRAPTLGGDGAVFALSVCNKTFLGLQILQFKHRVIAAMQKL
jgi:hypothetical protein